MARRPGWPVDYWQNADPGPYVLIVKGDDRQPHSERFDDANSYKTRLASLQSSPATGLSVDEVVGWLETHTAESETREK